MALVICGICHDRLGSPCHNRFGGRGEYSLGLGVNGLGQPATTSGKICHWRPPTLNEKKNTAAAPPRHLNASVHGGQRRCRPSARNARTAISSLLGGGGGACIPHFGSQNIIRGVDLRKSPALGKKPLDFRPLRISSQAPLLAHTAFGTVKEWRLGKPSLFFVSSKTRGVSKGQLP